MLHDRIIVATARVMGAKILSKDPHIRKNTDSIW